MFHKRAKMVAKGRENGHKIVSCETSLLRDSAGLSKLIDWLSHIVCELMIGGRDVQDIQ